MVLQNVVLSGKPDIDSRIYYRTLGEVQTGASGITIPEKSTFYTDSYQNAFDIGAWKKYTEVQNLLLRIRIRGKGKITVWKENFYQIRQILSQKEFDSAGAKADNEKEQIFHISKDVKEGIVYFGIQAEKECVFESATYETECSIERDIKVSIVICTYKRRSQLEQLLEELRSQGKNAVNQWMRMIVVDNASELSNGYGKDIHVYHNRNTGGAGGFFRGMEETVKNMQEFPATHVLLLDDDVILQKESVYRLYALLSYEKKEYEKEVIAGRMFRLDQPHVQYTAAEIWNGGNIKHIGWNQDMTDRSRLFSMNENAGAEYSGWWFACFPIEFVKRNRPMPFFLHCDDVEYGLRHGGTPIILNGIQVWHETYEYRQSPVIAYYDMRNTLIVNAIYGLYKPDKEVLQWWKSKISRQHLEKQYLKEYMLILGMRDYLRGKQYFEKHDVERKNKRLRKKRGIKIVNSLLWRMTVCIYSLNNKQIIKSYQIDKK